MFERTKNAVGSLGAARAAADNLAAVDRDLRERHAATVHRIRELATNPEPADAIVENMRAAVDEAAANFATEYGYRLVSAFTRKIKLGDDLSMSVAPHTAVFWPTMSGPNWHHVCWLAPESVKRAFEQAIRAQSYVAGLPIAERRAAITKAQAELQAIEAEHENLVDEAAKAGIGLQHLPTTAARREADARRAELDAQATAARQRLAQRVGETYPEASGVGRSSYLAGGRQEG